MEISYGKGELVPDVHGSPFDWLRSHYLAKMPKRISDLNCLPLIKGDRVLDIGCGPGIFTIELAKRIGDSGYVTGIDKSPSHIHAANELKSVCPEGKLVEFKELDVETLNFERALLGEKFTVVTFFNSASYLRNPGLLFSKIFEAFPSLRCIIVKDTDFSHICVPSIEPELLQRIVRLAKNDQLLDFDNFFGTKIFSLLSDVEGTDCELQIWSYPMAHPLSADQRKYVQGNLKSLLVQALPFADSETKREIESSIFLEGDNCLLDKQGFYFVSHEFVGIATKSKKLPAWPTAGKSSS